VEGPGTSKSYTFMVNLKYDWSTNKYKVLRRVGEKEQQFPR